MGGLHVPKKIDKSVMWEFVTNNQNFDRPYIARYKNSSQVFFYPCKVIAMKAISFWYTLA